MVIHERSYRGFGLAQLVHRARLTRVLRLVGDLTLPEAGTLADLGCSNGFIISQLKNNVFRNKDYRYFGFDHSRELLAAARQKKIEGATFHHMDLNKVDLTWNNQFDAVMCLETLEHVGDYRSALQNVVSMCRPGGSIIISIPNERGLPGILKYFARKLLRRRAYRDFFAHQSELKYIRHLFFALPIEGFRDRATAGWGPHLGFDWKVFREHLLATYVSNSALQMVSESSSFLKFNLFYVLTKADVPESAGAEHSSDP